MRYVLLLFFLTSILFSNEHKKNSYNKLVSNYGFYSKGSFLSNFKDSQLALTMLGEEIAKAYKTKINIIFYEDNIDVYNAFIKDNKLTMIILGTKFFYAHKKQLDKIASSFLTVALNTKRHRQLYLISNYDSNKFEDIRNKTVSFNKYDNTAFTWIDKASLTLFKKPILKLTKNIIKERSESVALLKVFFEKSDMAVVTKRTWDTMIELNPSIKNKIKIIQKSTYNQIPIVGIFKKDTSKLLLNAFFDFTGNLNSNLRNKQIINILKIDHIYKLKTKTLDKIGVYYKEYFKLQEQYQESL